MAFQANLSGTAELDSSIVLAFDQSFIIANGQANVVDQFVTYKQEIGAKSIQLTRYDLMPINTTPLDERAEVTGTAMSDSAIILTPREFGDVISRTKLASLQTGGKADVAAAALVGQNMGQTTDRLGLMALEASANTFDAGGIMTPAALNKVYNKLSRENVPMIDGAYVAFLHDDVIADIRAGAAGGDWTDVVKYATPETALRNEVGMFKGFRIVRDNLTSVAAGTYKSSFLGFNGLGKAESAEPTIVVSGPFDALGRVVNVGWYGVFEYKIIEPKAVWTVTSTSSLA